MSASEVTGSRPSISLDQLVAFNDELEALVRAGIPLERGLLAASGDYRGRLGAAIRELGERLEAGERLPDALAKSKHVLPDVYRAMVEAGLRSGRLADALQGLSRVGLAVVEARRTIVLACFYPLLVLVMAYALFLFFLIVVFPRFTEAAGSLRIEDSAVIGVFEQARGSVAVWGPIIPLGLLGILFAWSRTGRSHILDGASGISGPLASFPWVGRIVANYRAANFITLLAHLVDHDVPLDQAVRLAGDAAANPRFRRSVGGYADQIAAGSISSDVREGSSEGFPPLVAWMIESGHRQGSLASGLKHLATSYRRRADRQAETFRIILPGLMILVVGTGAVLAYGLLLFVPLRHLWDGLANPLN